MGDFIERMASKYCHEERVQYPFCHVCVSVGDDLHGYYRADCLTTGIQYSHAWTLPVGHTFVIDADPLVAFMRAWHPSTKTYRTSMEQMRRQLRGSTYQPPDLETGKMNCVTFSLLCIGRLDLPHRFPELYRALEAEGHIIIRKSAEVLVEALKPKTDVPVSE